MDDYVEAQIHGGMQLSRDVLAVVADPSLCDTPTGVVLASLPAAFGLDLRWHTGFRLSPDRVPADLRSALSPVLAAHVCARYGADTLDAAVLGRAARSVVTAPAEWAAFGDRAQVLQELKYLWHILVILG
jgi:hypothetical protein